MSLILLVDDDEDMLAMTGRWLEKAGYEVSKVSSGRDALDYLSGKKPDLILLDYAMPEMDGPQVLKEIRSRKELDEIPVLYRTGMEENRMEAEDGMPVPDGIIPKSEGKVQLLKAISEVLDK